MGLAIANEAYERGADVILVLGPVTEAHCKKGIKTVNVVSADEMAKETLKYFPRCDIAILTAAVADYTPETSSASKIKKQDKDMLIRLRPTTDIAAQLGKIKRKGQFLAGFALETDNELINAKEKLKKKNLDLIVLNSLRDEGAGFSFDTNRVMLIDKNNKTEKLELKSKVLVASDILNKIEKML